MNVVGINVMFPVTILMCVANIRQLATQWHVLLGPNTRLRIHVYEDAAEFITQMLEQLLENPILSRTIRENFQIRIQTQMKCSACGRVTNSNQEIPQQLWMVAMLSAV